MIGLLRDGATIHACFTLDIYLVPAFSTHSQRSLSPPPHRRVGDESDDLDGSGDEVVKGCRNPFSDGRSLYECSVCVQGVGPEVGRGIITFQRGEDIV